LISNNSHSTNYRHNELARLPTVYLMLGLPGSGKSTFSKKLAENRNLDRFDFDLEYAKFGGDLDDHKWDSTIATKTYDAMKHWTAEQLTLNKSVVLDYCPWIKKDRLKFQEEIKSLDALSYIYYFEVDQEELLQRLVKRNTMHNGSQYVTKEMLDDFIKIFEVPIDESIEIIKS
jgi:adenylate kinase family enzyme